MANLASVDRAWGKGRREGRGVSGKEMLSREAGLSKGRKDTRVGGQEENVPTRGRTG